MDNDRNERISSEETEKSRGRIFLKYAGLVALSVFLAVLTVFVISLNR